MYKILKHYIQITIITSMGLGKALFTEVLQQSCHSDGFLATNPKHSSVLELVYLEVWQTAF